MGGVIVSMKNIVKNFPGVKALDNVDFELRSGEVMALLGENGAGKSTLMKILSGVYTKDGGTMEIYGKSYDTLTPKQAQAAGVAATIVMPTTTPLVKVNNTKDYGAQVVLHGEVFDDAAELAAPALSGQGPHLRPPLQRPDPGHRPGHHRL